VHVAATPGRGQRGLSGGSGERVNVAVEVNVRHTSRSVKCTLPPRSPFPQQFANRPVPAGSDVRITTHCRSIPRRTGIQLVPAKSHVDSASVCSGNHYTTTRVEQLPPCPLVVLTPPLSVTYVQVAIPIGSPRSVPVAVELPPVPTPSAFSTVTPPVGSVPKQMLRKKRNNQQRHE